MDLSKFYKTKDYGIICEINGGIGIYLEDPFSCLKVYNRNFVYVKTIVLEQYYVKNVLDILHYKSDYYFIIRTDNGFVIKCNNNTIFEHSEVKNVIISDNTFIMFYNHSICKYNLKLDLLEILHDYVSVLKVNNYSYLNGVLSVCGKVCKESFEISNVKKMLMLDNETLVLQTTSEVLIMTTRELSNLIKIN